jgi:hypothetical protein
MREHYTQLKDGKIVGFSHCTPEKMRQYAAKRNVQLTINTSKRGADR